MTSITSFGQKGPYSHYKGGELVASAMSGVLLSNGYADRAPVKEALDANCFHANGAALLGTIMAHYERENSGEGQQVDISIQEVSVSRNTNNILPYLFDKKMLKRSGDCQWLGLNPARWIWECKDGYVWHNLMGGKVGAPANRALSKWLDDNGIENPLREIEDWDKYDRSSVTMEQKTVREKAMSQFFRRHTKKELDEEGRKRGINTCVINTPAEVTEHPQLKARDYWVDLEHPELGRTIKYPGHFYLSTETTTRPGHRAPLIGEHNELVYKDVLGLSKEELIKLKEEDII
jgi:crotonobetainyl-CoA:carnitine CoA-transferase CaiB-like acyl-CoA transferase